jgi:hypothetical protein
MGPGLFWGPFLFEGYMKKIRLVAALFLAFGSLAFAQPALASEWQTINGRVVDGSVQFDYRGGSAVQTLQVAEGSTIAMTVNNTTANCIGTCTPIPDTWSLTINGQTWQGNSIEVFTVETVVSGEVIIQVSGKDEGFWGGWYGPVFSAPVVTEPAVETGTWEGQLFSAAAPAGEVFTAVTGWYGAPNDPNCGADVSAILATYLGSNTFEVSADNGVFGDPCGGVVKVLRVNLTSAVAPTQIEILPTPTPTPTETPTSVDAGPDPQTPVGQPVSQPEPSPIPTVEPVVTPPVVEPAPQPQPIPFPVEPAPAPVEPPLSIEPSPQPPQEVEPAPTPPVDIPLETVEESEPTQIEEQHIKEARIEEEPLPIQPPVVESVEEKSIAVIEDLKEIAPEEMTDAQVAQLEAAVMAVFETAKQGSPEYAQALEALTVLAQADDVKLPAELAAIPLLGDAAGAALEAFNAIGNIGADMSPAVREQAEDAVVASVIVGQVASAAASAAVSASAASSTRKIK